MADVNPTQPAVFIPARGVEDDSLLERVEKLEDAIARIQSTSATPSASLEEQLSERVMAILNEKMASQRLLAPQPAVPMLPAFPPGMMDFPSEQSIWQWLYSNVLGELKLLVRMYFDPRYRLSRLTQFGVPAILLLVVVNYLFFNFSCLLVWPLSILAHVLERVLVIVAAYFLVKVLQRELSRYRQVLDYLARYGYS